MNAFVRLLYALLIAVSVVIFVGFSIASVYQPPEGPDYGSMAFKESDTPEERDKRNEDFEKQRKNYEAQQKNYQRNVTYALLPISTAFVAIGLWLMRKKSEILGEGLALGGIGSLIYATITSSIANHPQQRLAAVSLLLVSTLLVAQHRFSIGEPKKKS